MSAGPSEKLPPAAWTMLVCPMCGRSLAAGEGGALCRRCDRHYPITPTGQLDLRLQRLKTCTVNFAVGGGAPADSIAQLIRPMPTNADPKVDWRSVPIPPLLRCGHRLTPQLLSYFPKSSGGGFMLDLGCGEQLFRELAPHTGYEYIGLDSSGDRPMLLGDAHALPFKDASIDFVLSLAVIEHLRYPAIAIREVARVLKPGGMFIGSVGFLEPYHMCSYFHPSPLGTYDLLRWGGFEIQQLEPNVTFSGLEALGVMSLFPHAPDWLARALVLPLQTIHRLWWKLGHLIDRRPASSEQARRILNAAGFRFVCMKPRVAATVSDLTDPPGLRDAASAESAAVPRTARQSNPHARRF